MSIDPDCMALLPFPAGFLRLRLEFEDAAVDWDSATFFILSDFLAELVDRRSFSLDLFLEDFDGSFDEVDRCFEELERSFKLDLSPEDFDIPLSELDRSFKELERLFDEL